jgi:hypothetical protein
VRLVLVCSLCGDPDDELADISSSGTTEDGDRCGGVDDEVEDPAAEVLGDCSECTSGLLTGDEGSVGLAMDRMLAADCGERGLRAFDSASFRGRVSSPISTLEHPLTSMFTQSRMTRLLRR